MTAADWMRMLIGVVLILMFLVTALVNWGIFLAFIFRRIPKGRSVSGMPLVGALFGCGGFAAMPLAWFNHHWWLPMFLDMGCIPGILIFLFSWPFWKKTRGDRS